MKYGINFRSCWPCWLLVRMVVASLQKGIGPRPLYIGLSQMMMADGLAIHQLNDDAEELDKITTKYLAKYEKQSKKRGKVEKLFQKETSRIQLILEEVEQA